LDGKTEYQALDLSDISVEYTKANQTPWKLKKLPLKRVVVGPSRFGGLAEQSMKGFLQSIGWDENNYEIAQTASPYRVM
jgi:hypothetical protein